MLNKFISQTCRACLTSIDSLQAFSFEPMDFKQALRATLAIIIIALLVTSCTQQKSYEYYLLHPNKIEAVYNRCTKAMSAQKAMANQQCVMVFKAAKAVRNLLMQATSDQEAFGAKILHAQMQLAAMQQQIKSAKSQLVKMKKQGSSVNKTQVVTKQKELSQLHKKVDELELRVRSMLAIVRFINSQLRG